MSGLAVNRLFFVSRGGEEDPVRQHPPSAARLTARDIEFHGAALQDGSQPRGHLKIFTILDRAAG